ncbi:hypothetical protein B1B04_24435 [Lysinibacillus sp. KCTC 33748]|uniref:hypothetical protein n=1 Tax=unclassified Lysinibacillus TaxID=2636778 RepID=UPI0009A70E46|nr:MULTISPECIES: hypothetical protein [unclassified Lysinibacillus]OXS66096.1 hypothetical protein B1B04_24435 [Lysinibacillus sp. KCTC 33748]SKC18452.1 hypothetical protein SAMN06295926_13728 [Lysinibacillus sp. AC-3]
MTIEEQILANPVLREMKNLLELQTAKGIAKYGTTVNPMDHYTIEWLKHFREEMIDGAVYATVVIQKLEEMQKGE